VGPGSGAAELMLHFCTYFDRNYLSRGIALYESLREHGPPFALWTLCMDAATHEALTSAALPGLHPIGLEEMERGDDALLRAKRTRSPIEYYFTCTPSLPRYVFARHPEVDLLTYLDADLYFFADPTPLLDEVGQGSIGIIEHGGAGRMPSLAIYGRYNVGWITFRRDEDGLACLEWWRERCLEWCYDRAEDGRFAEQKYLDQWPERFPGVVILAHPGANVAPWNLAGRRIAEDRGRLLVDGEPLLFFHFHGFKQVRRWLFDPNLSQYRTPLTDERRRTLYLPYIAALRRAARRIGPHLAGAVLRQGIRTPRADSAWRRALDRSWRFLRDGYGLVAGRYIVARPDRP
jgi:hypothetical protein